MIGDDAGGAGVVGDLGVVLLQDGEDDDDEALAGPAAVGIAADEEEGPGVGEDEGGVAAVETEEWVGDVAGVVVALAHHQHHASTRARRDRSSPTPTSRH
ncbi:hypothetical protein E2562_000575 [Oryza meyeriana var. granulata]|uniref:DUF834 domain-containing protein n=1 Tax=Oryza meyeriana var. granulata TaxID=110450 RepID=A0A6G1DU42_9ORYZ|nr:hypothetical protein E2562_000575 [Oryza meyeriana var. granulata]